MASNEISLMPFRRKAKLNNGFIKETANLGGLLKLKICLHGFYHFNPHEKVVDIENVKNDQ